MSQNSACQFIINGKTVTDSVLFPWALGSIARALLFYAEATEPKKQRPLKAIAAYYALFHLTLFAMYACPGSLENKIRENIQNYLNKGKDPNPTIGHGDAKDFLEICKANGLNPEVLKSFEELRQIRNFINYGPRVYWKPGYIKVDSCEFSYITCRETIETLEYYFKEMIRWICCHGVDNGIWISPVLGEAKNYFSGSEPYYSDWTSKKERDRANKLRSQLKAISFKQAYKKK